MKPTYIKVAIALSSLSGLALLKPSSSSIPHIHPTSTAEGDDDALIVSAEPSPAFPAAAAMAAGRIAAFAARTNFARNAAAAAIGGFSAMQADRAIHRGRGRTRGADSPGAFISGAEMDPLLDR